MNTSSHTLEQFKKDLHVLGLHAGDIVMMHCSYKSLGGVEGGAEGIFAALEDLLGPEGTLILPAFSYATVNYDQPIFDRKETLSCIGYLPEYFRTKVPGVIRSMHATHSCSLKGKHAEDLAAGHELDLTPVGPNSPMAKLPKIGGKILILGSHPDHNTALHGVEETAEPPYLFNRTKPIHYILRDGEREIHQDAIHHGFHFTTHSYAQRYSRILNLLQESEYSVGKVLDATCYLMDAKAVWERGHAALLQDPYYFVERIELH